jgi:hypothetical protein
LLDTPYSMQPCVGDCTYLEEYRWTEI